MHHLRMPEEVKSNFSTCFLSILHFQKTHGKAAAAAGVTVNSRAWTMLRLCHRGHCSPERLVGAGPSCSQRMLLPLLHASSKTQRKSISLGQQELSSSDTRTQVDRFTEGTWILQRKHLCFALQSQMLAFIKSHLRTQLSHRLEPYLCS